MAQARPISGFPEWLPEQQLVENEILERVREQFELHGFAPLRTRSVEPLDVLLAKGETDKEIYAVQRLHAEGDEEAGIGLHYDLTVPFARYVAEHRGVLQFPFRRYQIQPAWRGERPQEGRYREFLQADVDIVAQDELPVEHDAEIARVVHAVLAALPIPAVRLRINNRKILQGFYLGLGVEDVVGALRTVDKLAKIGPDQVRRLLVEQVGMPDEAAGRCLALGRVQGAGAGVADEVRALGVAHPTLDEGLAELALVLDRLSDLPEGAVVADLSIARGFDYYTGTVYEGELVGHEGLGAVCSGGRYDNLVSAFTNARLPGVGISLGISRILGRLLGEGLLRPSRSTPACVLVALEAEEARPAAQRVATALRRRGIACDVFSRPQRYGKQIRFAERLGIPFVWFTHGAAEGETTHEVRDIRSGEQVPADPAAWEPPAADRRVRLERVEPGS